MRVMVIDNALIGTRETIKIMQSSQRKLIAKAAVSLVTSTIPV